MSNNITFTPRSHPPELAAPAPRHFRLTSGQLADCKAGALLLDRLPTCRIVLPNQGYDSDAIRRQIEDARAAPNIPPRVNHRWK